MTTSKQQLKLNFLKINGDFEITVWRKITDNKTKVEDETLRTYNLYDENDIKRSYLISFDEKEEFEAYSAKSFWNISLTKAYIYELLKRYAINNSKYKISKRDFKQECFYTVQDYENKGSQSITIRPYFLNKKKEFGVLINFKFLQSEGAIFDKEIQKLSLSLDKNYRSNRYFYSDKFSFLNNFINNELKNINSYLERYNFHLEEKLNNIDYSFLNKKTYIFKDDKKNSSQFGGIKNFGAYKQIDSKVKFIFVFEDRYKSLANKIYTGLTGDFSPGTFPGLKKMFGIDITKENVCRVTVDGYDESNLDLVVKSIESLTLKTNEKPIVLFIEPYSNYEDSKKDSPYYYFKYQMTKKQIPVQFVTNENLKDDNTLKWSISNIGLQLFSKLGGIPWVVESSDENCLILGIGSSHEFDVDGNIKKYFAYTVCIDSSGIYRKVSSLASSDNEDDYLSSLALNLKALIAENKSYNKISIHLPFKIKRKEIIVLKKAIEEIDSSIDFEIIKINNKTDFICFSEHNSKIPYESTVVDLGNDEYLVWFEGLNYGKENVFKKIGDPVHLKFLSEIKESDTKRLMQDVLNLSGANWRGFNAKQLPVSIYYAQIVAQYMKGFDKLEDNGEDFFENIHPWFL
ncbi:MAG: hypothetical protein JJT77_09455 [Crocinitomicaceae bacterium]|nr:hypothetical protein [Crocinitomicaceae bacterium]